VQGHTEERRCGVWAVGRSLAFEVGLQHEPASTGLRLERELAELVVRDAEQSSGRVENAGRIEGRDEGKVDAARVSEPGDRAGLVAGRGLADGEDRAARADGDDDVAGRAAEAERRAGVVAGTGPDNELSGGDELVGREHARQNRVVTEGCDENLAVVLAGH
jgi:hypothetical protein